MKRLFFFGCSNDRKGHYWFAENERSISDYQVVGPLGVKKELIERLDNTFTPASGKQGIYKVSSVPPVMIISWADYTVDQRGNSNSNIVGIGYFGSHEMLEDAQKQFPNFMARQTILEPEKS